MFTTAKGGRHLRFYTKQHTFYCVFDLHARSTYVCILDGGGDKLLHRQMPSAPDAFLGVIAPYREDIVVIDSHKIAVLLRGGMLPRASVYPREMRATRDLLRRRMLPHAPPLRTARPRPEHHIARIPRVQGFVSYARLVQCPKGSAGKRTGSGTKQIGFRHQLADMIPGTPRETSASRSAIP